MGGFAINKRITAPHSARPSPATVWWPADPQAGVVVATVGVPEMCCCLT